MFVLALGTEQKTENGTDVAYNVHIISHGYEKNMSVSTSLMLFSVSEKPKGLQLSHDWNRLRIGFIAYTVQMYTQSMLKLA